MLCFPRPPQFITSYHLSTKWVRFKPRFELLIYVEGKSTRMIAQ